MLLNLHHQMHVINDTNTVLPAQNETINVIDTRFVSLVDASFLPQQVNAGAGVSGLGLYLKGRLHDGDFRIKVQAQANQASSQILAEAQAILLFIQVISLMQIQTGTLYSDNHTVLNTSTMHQHGS